MAVPPPKQRLDETMPHRRATASIVALWCLLALGAFVTWQVVRTADAPLPEFPTAQPFHEATPTTHDAQLAITQLTKISDGTPKPTSTGLPVLIVYYCGNRDNPGEICSPLLGPSPTSAPLLRCDDARLIGGQDCFWPTRAPESPFQTFWK
jgi:hypothetical protein